MNLADELRKLEELRREGVLTEEEFAQAKRSVLGSCELPLSDKVQE